MEAGAKGSTEQPALASDPSTTSLTTGAPGARRTPRSQQHHLCLVLLHPHQDKGLQEGPAIAMGRGTITCTRR